MRDYDELVVFCHLRWSAVWQRPQQLVSRLGAGVPTWFVEEPMSTIGATTPALRCEVDGPVTCVWWEVPETPRWTAFHGPDAEGYGDALAALLPPRPRRMVWLYTAMALELAERLAPSVVVYDVMDDLASFAGAAPGHRAMHRAALRRADVVFTGGRSLHAAVTAERPTGTYCFPSGVEQEHYARSVALRPARRERPVAGYVGVVDERLDLGLLAGLAAALPDWEVVVVGPFAKLDGLTLPEAPNLHWIGKRRYHELPAIMAGFDVAVMPFALNDATRSISPTKTLEYLAAGLPVVSTRVPDVVAEHSGWVRFADDAAGFAAACRAALVDDHERRRDDVAGLLQRRSWDDIAARMAALLPRPPATAPSPVECVEPTS